MTEELQFPPVEVSMIEVGGDTVEGYKAVRNPETGHVFDITSEKYKLVRHEEVLDNVESTIKTKSPFGPWTRSVSLYQEGARMRTKYTFPETTVEVQKGDFINPTIEVFNSYDRSMRHTVMLGAFRLVCTNGMVVGKKFMQFRKRHMPDLYLEDVEAALSLGMDKLELQTSQWKTWAEKKLEREQLEKAIKKLDLNKKETKLLLNEQESATQWSLDRWITLFDMGDSYEEERNEMTWWIFYNILTQFTTHRIESENRRLQLENNIRKVVY